ncbi:MAG: hypothetical protein GXY81_01670 [Candidatus Cloacimonetes bacterium]|nr:hypothetical protein [Candidatus Cloacimonadota bacterium]
MEHYDQILEYTSYFEIENNEYGKEVYTPNNTAYRAYEKELESFMLCISESDLMRVDHFNILDKSDYVKNIKEIESAGFGILKALFTYFDQQGRFEEGLWVESAECGILLRLLKRFKAIVREELKEEIMCQK